MSSATGRDTDLLRFYDNEGIKLVRLSHRTKKPVDSEWQQRPLALEDVQEWVRSGGDVGWQCGEVSGWMAAVDLDCGEARRLAPKFLPETLRGAKGKETPSQYFYRSSDLGYKKFSEIGGTAELIALKASNNGRGHQVAVAPSVHRERVPITSSAATTLPLSLWWIKMSFDTVWACSPPQRSSLGCSRPQGMRVAVAGMIWRWRFPAICSATGRPPRT